MENSTQQTPKSNLQAYLAISFVCVFSLTVAWMLNIMQLRVAIDQERQAAWGALVQNATTPEERQLLTYLSQNIPGCFVSPSLDPARLTLKTTIFPSKVREIHLPVLLAHEQYCLDSIRGQALAASIPGSELLSEVEIPR